MDHEHQVNPLVSKTRDSFLSLPLATRQAAPENYDLEKEFAQTKKNHHFFIPLLITGFVAVIIAGSWILYTLVENRNRQFEVQVADFEELRIREAFDELQKQRQSLALINRELSLLGDELKREEERLSLEYRTLLEGLAQTGTPEAAKESPRVEAEGRKQIESLRLRYTPRITELEGQLGALNAQIAADETALETRLQGRESYLNTQEKLFQRRQAELDEYYRGRLAEKDAQRVRLVRQQELASKRLTDIMNSRRVRELSEQELKYNPRFDDPRLTELTGLPGDAEWLSGLSLGPQTAKLSPVLEEGLQQTNQKTLDQRYLFEKLKTIPFVNSVPGMMAALESLAVQNQNFQQVLLDVMEKIIVEKESQLEVQKAETERLAASLGEIARKVGGVGLILSGTPGQDYILLLRDPGSFQPGTVLRVFRRLVGLGGNQTEAMIGEVTLKAKETYWKASLTQQAQATVVPEILDRLERK